MGAQVGTVIRSLNGFEYSDADLCECLHWNTQHVGGGTRTCEGRGCGCYTFRPINRDINTDVSRHPKCNVCERRLFAKRITVKSKVLFEIRYTHMANEVNAECVELMATESKADLIAEEEMKRRAQEEYEEEYWSAEAERVERGQQLRAAVMKATEPVWAELNKPDEVVLEGRAPYALGEEV